MILLNFLAVAASADYKASDAFLIRLFSLRFDPIHRQAGQVIW